MSAAIVGGCLSSETALNAGNPGPSLRFPAQARERIAVASYPFREFIAGPEHKQFNPAVALQDFAAHVASRFGINKIEPWSAHFISMDPKYLEQFRTTVETARAQIVNVAVDGEHSPYAADRTEREKAVTFGKRWIDAAASLGSPGIRINIPPAGHSAPDLERTADSLLRVVEHASAKNVVVNLENDNPVSEDPFFLVKLIDKVNSPWLHALPDFANTLSSGNEEHAYSGMEAMFRHAYSICHVKDGETNESGKLVEVDMARAFGYLKHSGYKGYCSMEWDRPGDPYHGTADLIEKTVQYLS
ncbi:MAG: sugar phosphate isomerase/epimerase family protein [Terriglobales bacterium]